LVDVAVIAEIPEARFYGDLPPPFTEEWLREDTEEDLRARIGGVMDTEHHYLAISGGGGTPNITISRFRVAARTALTRPDYSSAGARKAAGLSSPL
jgi:hypothetical protein